MKKVLVLSLLFLSCSFHSKTPAQGAKIIETVAAGPKGETGAIGLPGANAVINVYSPTANQCPYGGLLFDTFTDINANDEYNPDVDTNYRRSLLCLPKVKKEDND